MVYSVRPDVSGGVTMDGIWQDLRHALRWLTRERGLSGAVILILALGIGPNALVFSVLRASLLRPLPYPEAERLVLMWNHTADSPRSGVAVEELEQWSQQRGLFESLAGFMLRPGLVLTGVPEPERLQAVAVSPSLFDVLGVHPAVGRSFLQRGSADQELILSCDLWRRKFNADRGVIGKRVSFSDRGYTVVGVMPEGFDFPRLIYPRWNAVDAWLPLDLSPSERRNRNLFAVGRLQRGISLEGASRRLTTLLPATVRPDVTGVSVVDMHQAVVGEVREGLLLLASAVGLVLLLACASVANLLLTGAEARQRDAAIRFALGATRGRVARQLVAEALLLALGGGGLGLLFAQWGTRLIPAILPADFPRLGQPRIDVVVIVVGLLSAGVAGIISGLAPGLAATARPIAGTLSGTGNPFTASRRHGFRSALVATEAALALVLATAAILTLRGFWRLVFVPAGFDPTHVLTVNIGLSPARYASEQEISLFVSSLLQELRNTPAVEAAAAGSGMPGIFPGSSTAFRLSPGSDQGPGAGPEADLDSVTGDYFLAMGIPLLMGRSFGPDDRPTSRHVVIADATAARFLGPGSALHKQVILTDPMGRCEVVGVVGRVHLFGAPEDTGPHVYVPMTQFPLPGFALVLRSRQPTGKLVGTVRRLVSGIDPKLPIGAGASLSQLIAAQTSSPRFHLAMLAAFGLLALALASFGVFSVTAYVVSVRKQEFAVRSALGASPAALLGLILRNGAKTLLQGLAAGLAVAVALADSVSAALPEVKGADPLAFGAAIIVVILSTLGATLIAARRVRRTDPATMLRVQ